MISKKQNNIKKIIILINIKFKKNNIYRLRFLDFPNEKRKENYIDLPLNCFKPPENIKIQEACLIISHIKDIVDEEYPKYLSDLQKAKLVNALLNTYGFDILTEDEIQNKNIIDLYIVSGSQKKFKESEHYKKYIEWYTPNITYSDVITINNQTNKRKVRRKGQ